MQRFAKILGAGALVLALITGGSSALVAHAEEMAIQGEGYIGYSHDISTSSGGSSSGSSASSGASSGGSSSGETSAGSSSTGGSSSCGSSAGSSSAGGTSTTSIASSPSSGGPSTDGSTGSAGGTSTPSASQGGASNAQSSGQPGTNSSTPGQTVPGGSTGNNNGNGNIGGADNGSNGGGNNGGNGSGNAANAGGQSPGPGVFQTGTGTSSAPQADEGEEPAEEETSEEELLVEEEHGTTELVPEDENVPLAAFSHGWGVVNLLAILLALGAAAYLLAAVGKRRGISPAAVITGAFGILPTILFILLEDFGTVRVVTRWTPLFLCITLFYLIAVTVVRVKIIRQGDAV